MTLTFTFPSWVLPCQSVVVMFTFTNGGRSYVLGGMYWLVNFKVPARYLKNRLGFINQLLLLHFEPAPGIFLGFWSYLMQNDV